MEQHGCIFLDAKWNDMLSAYLYTIQGGDRSKVTRELEGLFGKQCLACFSVRSALDLFLSVMNYPKGSEILMTAINIPDMVIILEHHGLNVIPVDIDIETLAPVYDDMKQLVTPRTVAVLTAHIYGRWTSMNAIINVVNEYNLLLLEDCAESFSGLSDLGHPRSDLVFFSFGAIKYATAMGGGIVKVKDPEILQKMQSKLMNYPIFAESDYLERLFRYSVVMFLVNNPLVTKFGVRFMHYFGINYKEAIVSLLRGFPGNVIKKIRRQPSTSMLRMMLRQLQQFDSEEHARAKINGDFVLKKLCEDILIPGCNADRMNYWLFPILVDNPGEWVKELERERIEAYNGVTQLNLIKPNNFNQTYSTKDHCELRGKVQHSNHEQPKNDVCSDSAHRESFGSLNHTNISLYPHKAKFLIDHVLYLPVHKRVPLQDLLYLCQSVLKVAQRRHGIQRPKELLLDEFRKIAKL